MCKSGLIGVTVLALMLALTGCAANDSMSHRHHHDHDDDDDANEVAVTMDQLPAAVKATLMKEAGNGKIEEIDKMTHHGRTVFEADVMLDGKKWEITVRDDGQLIRKELDEETDDEDDRHEKSERR
jgi:uncharacterized membrane protein YkoI